MKNNKKELKFLLIPNLISNYDLNQLDKIQKGTKKVLNNIMNNEIPSTPT